MTTTTTSNELAEFIFYAIAFWKLYFPHLICSKLYSKQSHGILSKSLEMKNTTIPFVRLKQRILLQMWNAKKWEFRLKRYNTNETTEANPIHNNWGGRSVYKKWSNCKNSWIFKRLYVVAVLAVICSSLACKSVSTHILINTFLMQCVFNMLNVCCKIDFFHKIDFPVIDYVFIIIDAHFMNV